METILFYEPLSEGELDDIAREILAVEPVQVPALTDEDNGVVPSLFELALDALKADSRCISYTLRQDVEGRLFRSLLCDRPVTYTRAEVNVFRACASLWAEIVAIFGEDRLNKETLTCAQWSLARLGAPHGRYGPDFQIRPAHLAYAQSLHLGAIMYRILATIKRWPLREGLRHGPVTWSPARATNVFTTDAWAERFTYVENPHDGSLYFVFEDETDGDN